MNGPPDIVKVPTANAADRREFRAACKKLCEARKSEKFARRLTKGLLIRQLVDEAVNTTK